MNSKYNECNGHLLAKPREMNSGLISAGYEILNDVALNQVVFACRDDASTRRSLKRIQSSGVTWLGLTTWKGRDAMRIRVSSWKTTEQDVHRSRAVMADAFSDQQLVD